MHPFEILVEKFPNWRLNYPDDRAFINTLWEHALITDQERLDAFFTPIDPIPEDDLSLKDKISMSLFRRVSGFFIAMWDGVWESALNATQQLWIIAANLIRDPWDNFLHRFAKDKFEDEQFVEFLPPAAKVRALRFKTDPNIADAFVLELYALGYMLGVLIAVIPILAADARHSLNKMYSPEIPDISSLIRYQFRYPDNKEYIDERAAELGFDSSEFDILNKANRPILEINFIKDLFLRDILTEEQTIIAIKRIGYNETEAKQIKELFYYIPSPPDQVRFAVREAFYPEYVEDYGLDQEYPQEFEDAVKKTGVSPEWAKMYWRSHWELPSLLMGYEMLHRGVINERTLDDLFKAADIMPYWREHLKAISYNPLTRVDVRRMHKIGVLDRDSVKRAYQDVGYNEKNAELMTEFTVLYNQENERDLTKADILAAYKRRLLTKNETVEYLRAMAYDETEIGVLITRIDYDLELTRKKLVLANLKKVYVRGNLTEVKVYERFGELDMTSSEGRELIELWDTEKKDQSRSLTRADLDKMFKAKVIDKRTYTTELKLLNYGDRDIGLLVKLNTAVKK